MIARPRELLDLAQGLGGLARRPRSRLCDALEELGRRGGQPELVEAPPLDQLVDGPDRARVGQEGQAGLAEQSGGVGIRPDRPGFERAQQAGRGVEPTRLAVGAQQPEREARSQRRVAGLKAALVVGDAFVPALAVKEHRDDLLVDDRELDRVVRLIGEPAKVGQRSIDAASLDQTNALEDRDLAIEARARHQHRASDAQPRRQAQPAAGEGPARSMFEQPRRDDGQPGQGERDRAHEHALAERDHAPDQQRADQDRVAPLGPLAAPNQTNQGHGADDRGEQEQMIEELGMHVRGQPTPTRAIGPTPLRESARPIVRPKHRETQ